MGTGKTSVGKRIAERLDMTFVDMDEVIEKRREKPISKIFAEDGEAHFRALERELVKELSASTGLVIGAGGGIVLNWDNITDYSKTGLVVCLSATPEAIMMRIENDASRPLLAGGDKMKKILEILKRRRELYNAVPRRIDTTAMSIEQVADKIIAMRRGVGVVEDQTLSER